MAKVSLGKERVEGGPVEAIIEVRMVRLNKANLLMSRDILLEGS